MVEHVLRVTSIRSQSPRGFGGCIFSGRPIDDQGHVLDAGAHIVVKASAKALAGVPVQTGQWWKVSGEASNRLLEVNGYQLAETQIDASWAVLARPSGEHIITFLAQNTAFEGIGTVKARKLWDAFGQELYEILDAGNGDRLGTVLSNESANQVVAAWAQQGDSRTLQWLQVQGFELSLGRKVLQFFGNETAEKLQEDPYRLLSFCAAWSRVDAMARLHFGVAVDDPRRLQGAIEEACYRILAAGHTTAVSSTVMGYLQGILGPQTQTFRWRELIPLALSQGLNSGSYIVGHHGVQPLGAYVMERQVTNAVAERLCASPSALLPAAEVDRVLERYQAAERIHLNEEQRNAVHLAALKTFVLITGGAGVGKTTVLKALYEVYDQAGVSVTQLALAGRAAKRMQEATGRSASTIASFLRTWKEGSFFGPCVIVIDEASMVDIITMSRLCEILGPSVRLVLVGDPAQLMPVGPGLVLHALARVPRVPAVQLKVVKRYGGEIAAAASAIREGRWPELPADPAGPIAFIPCQLSVVTSNDDSLPEVAVDLYRQDPANTQVLCARRNGLDGSKHLNALCQVAMTGESKPVRVWNEEHGCYALTGLHLGDPVLCTRNLWDRGLQNGSLGVVVQVEDQPRLLVDQDGDESGYAIAWVEWDDGVRRPIVEQMLDDIELGYAITVHKAQGSQWPRVIVPLTGHRLLDRTLIYTAVTRAQSQVLLLGDPEAARQAVMDAPRAARREVSLDLLLQRELAATLAR